MIEIIYNSLLEPTKVTCPTCESIFTYTFEDIKRDEISNIFDICGKKTIKRYVICPVCKSDLNLSPKAVYSPNAIDLTVKEEVKNK